MAFCSVLLLCIWNAAFPLNADSTSLEQNDTIESWYEYSALVQIVSAKSLDVQIASFKEFLFQYPYFEDIYLKLLDAFIQQNNLREAESFFQQLGAQPIASCLAEWMQAKIHILDYEKSAAEQHFLRAVSYSSLPLRGICDVIWFFQDSVIVSRILNKQIVHFQERYFILAMINQQIQNHNVSSKLFELITTKDKCNLLVFQLCGDSYYQINNLQKADSIWMIGLNKSKSIGDADSESRFLNSLGNLCNAKIQFDRAFNFFDRSDSIAIRIGNLHIMQLNAAGRAGTNYGLDRYEKALRYYEQAIHLAIIVRDDYKLAELYKYKGWTLFQLNQFIETINAYETSEYYSKRFNDTQNIIDSMQSRAEIFAFLDQNEIALEQYKLAYSLANHYNLKRLTLDIASYMEKINVIKGNYLTAIDQYIKYIQYLKLKGRIVEQAYWTSQVAEVYRLEGNIKQARTYYRRAVELFGKAQSPIYQAWYILALADLEALDGRFSQALLIRQKVDSMARAGNRPDLLADVQIGFGDDYGHLGDDRRSAASYRQAIQVIEKTRERVTIDQLRMGYFSRFSDIYRKLTGCYGRMAMAAQKSAAIDSILIYFLAGRERVMRDQLTERSRGNSPSTGEADSSYRQACLQLQTIQREARETCFKIPGDSLRYLQAKIEAARYSVLGQRLKVNAARSPASKEPVRENKTVSDVKEMLRREEASLLLIHVSESSSFVLALNENDTALVRLKIDSRILSLTVDSLVRPFHRVGMNTDQNVPFRADLAFRLYQTLIQPVESILEKTKSVIVLPDDALLQLPFEMLLDRKPLKSVYMPKDPSDYADAFLLHRYTFQYSPVRRAGSGRQPLFRRHPRMCLFANPYRSILSGVQSKPSLRSPAFGSFEPLPFAELEAEQIKRVHANVRAFVRNQATERRFAEEGRNAEILHFATHAFFDSTFQAFSGLALAETTDPADDGLLMGYEIADMNLDCDLVTLSACETGCGKRMAGEGILGLPRIFLGVGARSVLMTLWKVDDRFTSMMMPVFYDGYLNLGLTKAEALAAAKRSFFNNRGLKPSGLRLPSLRSGVPDLRSAATGFVTDYNADYDYRHPFYWASFMLFGEQGVGAGRGGLSVVFLCSVLVAGGLVVLILRIALRKRNNTKRQLCPE
jgi:CHAT domain-containing protein/tetratricopeptide (TPR) repeat protein